MMNSQEDGPEEFAYFEFTNGDFTCEYIGIERILSTFQAELTRIVKAVGADKYYRSWLQKGTSTSSNFRIRALLDGFYSNYSFADVPKEDIDSDLTSYFSIEQSDGYLVSLFEDCPDLVSQDQSFDGDSPGSSTSCLVYECDDIDSARSWLEQTLLQDRETLRELARTIESAKMP
ncbi:MAG: hypothetical protein U0905_23025 [Pirellulales bacterium]